MTIEKCVLLAFLMFAYLAVCECCDSSTVLDCSSRDYQYQTCDLPGDSWAYNDVNLIQKYSKSRCIKGTSYGAGSSYMFVKSGCRGKFSVCSCSKVKLLDCDSRGYKYNECTVPGASSTTYITVASKRSKSACTEDKSYGITGNKIWVHHGCRARFHVCYH